jgi:hypothetical protein
VTGSEVTLSSYTTSYYYSSNFGNYPYYYESGHLKIPGMWDPWVTSPSTYKTGSADLSTPYGVKQMDLYDYYTAGSVHRTASAPNGCYLPFQFTVDDNSGRHIVGSLTFTNIDWLKNA